MLNKRGQITLFVIVAILIVAIIAITFYFKGFGPFGLTGKIAPVEAKFLECIDDSAIKGLGIMGDQGGYIAVPEFEPGSEYAPFGSQFNFYGAIMPYWYYLSKSGEYKKQVPSINEIEKDLEEFIELEMVNCEITEFLQQGYDLTFEDPVGVEVDIRKDEVFIDVEWPINIDFGGSSRRVVSHSTKIESSFGGLYDLAIEVFDKEQSSLFLEDYTIDVLAVYAPGTGVEITCSPEIWRKSEVIEDLKEAFQLNVQTIKIDGDSYKLSDDERKYYVEDLAKPLKDRQVNFFYDKAFPTKIEVGPSEGDIMRADPIGNQEGLGILGFCYVPYHFVYTIAYPVIVQVFDENYNSFQFPLVVSIENNQPRGAERVEGPEDAGVELCEYLIQDFSVRTIDVSRNLVDADISFKCSGSTCHIGQASQGVLEAQFPQCINGFIVARKEGYADAKAQVSTNQGGNAEIIMRPKYKLDVRVLKDLEDLEEDESALITFTSDEASESIFYPTQDTITLAEGTYDVNSYLFSEGRIILEAQSIEKCVNVPRTGVFGFLGFEREDCYTINQPAQELNQLTIGGGKATTFLSDEDLKSASFIGVEIGSQPKPKSVLDLQDVYNNIALSTVGITLR